MSSSVSPSIVFAAILGAGVLGGATFALLRPAPVVAEPAPTHTAAPHDDFDPTMMQGGAGDTLPPGHPATGGTSLPPGHPAVGGDGVQAAPGMGAMGMGGGGDEEPAGITWKVPSAWRTVPNPSAMRLATYRVPKAAAVQDEADVSVMRAGGSTDANISRWVGQFQGAGKEKRETKKVNGVTVTTVEISGTFLGGGMAMGGGAATPMANWTLLGAIAEGPGTPYFFKLTGPSASVHAAQSDFNALLASIAPAK